MLATALYLTVAVSACSQIEPLQNDLTSAELTNAKNIKYTIRDLNNWGNLANHLSAAGVSDLRLAQVFSDKRIPTFIEYEFNVPPREPQNIYQGFNRPNRIKAARQFIKLHQAEFYRTQQELGIEPEIITAIFSVETDLGRNLGKHIIFYRLARLANANDPRNVQKNYLRLKKINPKITNKQVQARADKLQSMFMPEVLSLLQNCVGSCDVLQLRGSAAGAFGIPQFLPTSYQKHAVDFNRDGKRSLFQVSDSIASVAAYLKHHGWHTNGSKQEKKLAIWGYNHSQPYVDTVFQIYEELVKAK